jgi:inositol hexakisphosphate/diphosphoinositol-pentakisphosphate kinase
VTTLAHRTGIYLGGFYGTRGPILEPKNVELIDNGNTIVVDGVKLAKPFLEKPVNGDDHNITLYYHTKDGGGGRLFRKANSQSPERDDTLVVPKSITDPYSSYVYEQYLPLEASADIEVYTVGTGLSHGECRKPPVLHEVEGQDASGRGIRYTTKLSAVEMDMATGISTIFGQRLCRFDLLRTNTGNYVNNVNGWSFVKGNQDYWDKAAQMLKALFEDERQSKSLLGEEGRPKHLLA